MASNASPGTATPKMNESFVHMAHVSSDHACAQDGYLKRPHPNIIDGDMRWDSGWFLGGFWSWGTSNTRLAWQKLGKNIHPNHGGCHGALPPAPPHTTISQHAAQQVYVIKTREYYCF
jgi:hypothetical protein